MSKAPDKYAFDAEGYKNIFLPRYQRNPVLFAREILGVNPGGWQEGFLQRLKEGMATPQGARLALASGHKTGKTYISCCAMLWGLTVIPDCHIYCTSATSDQLKTRLWNYMKQLAHGSKISLWLDVDTEKVVFKYLPGNFIKAQAWSKDKPQSWAGEHCYSPWAIFDECSDIDPSIFEAWSGSEGSRNAVTVIMGQPRLRSGKLFDAFHKERDKWAGVHLSSVDSPFDTKEFVEDSRKSYGEDSDYYRIRVLGQFPKADSSQLFPDARQKALEDCPAPPSPAPPIVAGLDIAAGGADKTVLFIRRGNTVLSCDKFDSGDFNMMAQVISDTLMRHSCCDVAGDAIGFGYGLLEMLRARKELNVIYVSGSKAPVNKRKYHNRRSEAYGRLAEAWKDLRFQKGSLARSDMDNLGRQLEAIRTSYDKDMRMLIVPKLEIKEETGESPDLADALAYSFMCHSPGALSPEARKSKILEIRRAQQNSNPYRR